MNWYFVKSRSFVIWRLIFRDLPRFKGLGIAAEFFGVAWRITWATGGYDHHLVVAAGHTRTEANAERATPPPVLGRCRHWLPMAYNL